MIWKLTILLWVLALVARYNCENIQRHEKIRLAATLFGKARITPFRVLTCYADVCIIDYDGSNSNLVPVLLLEIRKK